MAFLVQDENGSVKNANAYVTVQEFLDYHADRGNDVDSLVSEGGDKNKEIEQSIVRGTDYLDTRFYYIGNKFNYQQTTEFPRDIWSVDNYWFDRIPNEVKEATCEYAFVSMNREINPTPFHSIGEQRIVEKTEKIGELEETVKYEQARSSMPPNYGISAGSPIYPKGDQKLMKSGLVVSGIKLIRT